jgi:predicted DNA-binding transcriptional regulator YafY
MSQFKSIERLSLILNFVNVNRYPSLENIISYLSDNKLKTTERTLQRDLKILREMCFIDVKYSRANDGYWIGEDSKHVFLEWMRVFNLFNRARTINEILLKSDRGLDVIDFDRNEQELKGDILGKVFSAVVDRKKIKFMHRSYWDEESKEIELYPHLLKQYLNRWYVFGCFSNGEFSSFGLDRVLELEVLSETFKLKNKKPKEVFNSVIGLVHSSEKLETIILSFEPFQGKYIKSQPIHPSQKIVIETDKELRIELRVKVNYELEEQILKHGQRVRVLEPKSFRKLIKNRLKEALAGYKSGKSGEK